MCDDSKKTVNEFKKSGQIKHLNNGTLHTYNKIRFWTIVSLFASIYVNFDQMRTIKNTKRWALMSFSKKDLLSVLQVLIHFKALIQSLESTKYPVVHKIIIYIHTFQVVKMKIVNSDSPLMKVLKKAAFKRVAEKVESRYTELHWRGILLNPITKNFKLDSIALHERLRKEAIEKIKEIIAYISQCILSENELDQDVDMIGNDKVQGVSASKQLIFCLFSKICPTLCEFSYSWKWHFFVKEFASLRFHRLDMLINPLSY